MSNRCLQSTAWLAKRLNLSVASIERLRAQDAGNLPPHITIGRHSIRYDEDVVDHWLAGRLHNAVAPVAVVMSRNPFKKRPVASSPMA